VPLVDLFGRSRPVGTVRYIIVIHFPYPFVFKSFGAARKAQLSVLSPNEKVGGTFGRHLLTLFFAPEGNSDGCSHYCLDWYGITCENGLITTIDLCRNNLNGTLPTSLPDISSLQTLRLSNNQIGGIIPACIGSLTNLTTLEMSNNSLVGTIPDSVKWTRLQNLDLSRNQIVAPLPESLYSLPLRHLNLGMNQLSGSLSTQIGQLDRMVYLDLSRNSLTGSIPITISKLQYLEDLILHNNQLTGVLHHETLASLKSLRKLLLNSNSLNGSMHAIAELDSLRVVSLSGNMFTGEIIPSIGRLTSLSTLDLSDNQLIGSLPMESIRELFVDGSLTFVNVYGNALMKSPTATVRPSVPTYFTSAI
jgi:Leucine-rich repeat (LRR) protein